MKNKILKVIVFNCFQLFSIVFNLQCSTNCAEIPIYTKGVAEAAPDPELLNIEAQVLAYYDQKKCEKYCSKRWSWWKMQLAEYLEDLMENMCELEEKNFFFIFIDPWNIIFRDILLATEPEERSIHLFRYINSLCIFCTTLEKGENGIPFDGVEFLKPYWEKYEEYITKLFHSSFFEKLTLANMVIGTYELTDLMQKNLNILLTNNSQYKEAINMMLSELGIGNDKIFSAIASEHYINEDCMPDNEGCMPDFDL